MAPDHYRSLLVILLVAVAAMLHLVRKLTAIVRCDPFSPVARRIIIHDIVYTYSLQYVLVLFAVTQCES